MHCGGEEAQKARRRPVGGDSIRNYDTATGMGTQEAVELGSAGRVTEEGADLGEEGNRPHPKKVFRYFVEASGEHELELGARVFLAAETAVYVGETDPPLRYGAVCLDETPEGGLDLLNAALFPAQNAELHTVGLRGIEDLRCLAQNQSILRLCFDFVEAAGHKRPHCSEDGGPPEVLWNAQLFGQCGKRLDLCICGCCISDLDEIDDP